MPKIMNCITVIDIIVITIIVVVPTAVFVVVVIVIIQHLSAATWAAIAIVIPQIERFSNDSRKTNTEVFI